MHDFEAHGKLAFYKQGLVPPYQSTAERNDGGLLKFKRTSSPDGSKQPLIRQKGVAESCSKFKEVLVFVLIIGQFLCLFDRSLIS